jgi:hypothetical protein
MHALTVLAEVFEVFLFFHSPTLLAGSVSVLCFSLYSGSFGAPRATRTSER